MAMVTMDHMPAFASARACVRAILWRFQPDAACARCIPGRTQVESHQTHALGAYAAAHKTIGVRYAYPSRPAPMCAC
jgi:hypothetical protein